MNYKYNNNAIQLRRDEDDGTSMVLLRETQHKLILNKTGNEILDILPDYTNSENLLATYVQRYPTVDSRILEKDIYEILKNFEIFNIINAIDNDDDKNDGIKYSMVGDVDYKKVSNFINKALSKKGEKQSASGIDVSYFSPLSLRTRTMKSKEFGVYCSENDIVISYMSISLDNITTSNTVTINHIFLEDSLSFEASMEAFSGMIAHCQRDLMEVKQFKKMRMALIKNDINHNLINFFLQCGFEEECVLKDENIQGDMGYYTLFFQK